MKETIKKRLKILRLVVAIKKHELVGWCKRKQMRYYEWRVHRLKRKKALADSRDFQQENDE